MSIFGSIKDFLFGKGKKAAPAPAPAPATPAAAAPVAPAAPQPQASPAPAAAQQTVDIAAVLDEEAKASGQTLNWRQSIVDLMKLTGIDPSLQNRKELAHELGYTGNTDDTATMNIWLHKAVIKKLEENGGQVPADLKD